MSDTPPADSSSPSSHETPLPPASVAATVPTAAVPVAVGSAAPATATDANDKPSSATDAATGNSSAGVEPKTLSLNAEELTPIGIGKQFQTRLPNVTLPGPSGGVSFALDQLGVPSETILAEEKEFDVVRIRVANGALTVFPKKEGEHELPVSIQTRDGKTFITTFLITVNPDPKTLWKDIPVPEGTPFAKPDRDTFHSDDGKIRIAAASQRGRTHAQQGTCRDDDMAFWSDPATGRYVLVVADGAGSAKYSRQGSKIAVETAVRELSEKLTDAIWQSDGIDFSPEGNVGKVLVGAARAAVGAIDAFVKQTKADPVAAMPDIALKDFNTTLLMAAVQRLGDGSLMGATFSIGDGAIAWWQPDKARLLCAPDGGEFSGQTKFLTTLSVWKDDYAVIQKARCFIFRKTAEEAATGRLFLMTDGVSDPFFETDYLLRKPDEWDRFQQDQLVGLNLFVDHGESAAAAAASRLLDWLSFWSVGNHDDRTIAVFGTSPQPSPVQPQNESARVESDLSEQQKASFLGRLFGHKS